MAEAAANGSAVAGKTAMAVVVSYIAFLGLLGFINSTLSWLGGRVGHAELNFGVSAFGKSGVFIQMTRRQNFDAMAEIDWTIFR